MAARMDPAARRARIIDAARAVAVRQGLARTTVRDIATEMGTSPGLVHHYIDSMDKLLAEVFETVAREGLQVTRAAIEEAATPPAQLYAFLTSSLRPGFGSNFQVWLDAWAEAARRPELAAVSRALNIEWQRLLAQIIEAGVARGDFRCPDPDASAWRLLSLLDGLVLQLVAHDITLGRDQVISWVLRAAESELSLPPAALSGAEPPPTLRILRNANATDTDRDDDSDRTDHTDNTDSEAVS